MARIMDIRGICIASVVLQTVIFGSGSAFTKLAYESISPLWALAIRFGLASAVFAVLFGPRIVRGCAARAWAIGFRRRCAWRCRTSLATWRST